MPYDGDAIGMHFAEKVAWFYPCEEEARISLSIVFRHFVEVAEALGELQLVFDAPPTPIHEWLRAVDWDRVGEPACSEAQSVLDRSVGDLTNLTHISHIWVRSAGEPGFNPGEVNLWSSRVPPARPLASRLLTSGMVETEWVRYLEELRQQFSGLASDCAEMPTEPGVARALLYRGFFLCMDLLYIGRLLEYASLLHGSVSE
jgi:hypothetical protein